MSVFSRTLSSRRASRAKSKIKAEPPAIDPQLIVKEGHLHLEIVPRFARKKLWYVLTGTHLFALDKVPNSDSDYKNYESVIDLMAVKQVKLERQNIILEMNTGKRNRRKVPAADQGFRRLLTQVKPKDAHVLVADSSNDASKWVQAMQGHSLTRYSTSYVSEEGSMAVVNAIYGSETVEEELRITKLIIKDMRTRKKIFETKRGLPGGKVPVKLLVGMLPSEFRVEVKCAYSNGIEVEGESEVFYIEELVEADSDKDAYEDRTISLSFDINNGSREIRVYLQVERNSLQDYELNTVQQKLERAFLYYVLLTIPQPYLSLLGFIILFSTLLVILKPFESFLFSLPTSVGLYPHIPLLVDYLLKNLQPYFITNVSLKTRKELDEVRMMRGVSEEGKKSHDASITTEEMALIEELRRDLAFMFDNVPKDSFAYEVLDKYINTDFRLVRFIRARNNNLVKAAAMVEKAMKWRIEYEADNIIEDGEVRIPEWLLEYAGSPTVSALLRGGAEIHPKDRISWFLRDKDSGQLAALVRTGLNNWGQIYRKLNYDQDKLFSYMIYVLQWARETLDQYHMDTNGEAPSYITFVADLKGMKSSNQIPLPKLYSLAQRVLPVFFTCYPEILHRVLIINAPAIFYTIFSMVKPLIPKRVLVKFMIHGSSKNLDNLAKVLDRKEIPASYGGDMIIDGDELCLQRIPSWGPYQPDQGKSLIY